MSEASLQEMLQRRSLPAKPLQLAILRQIATQLDQANQRGLVHGNLTPQSVIISLRDTGEGVSVFLKDFGTQFILDPTASNEPIPLNAYYLSPEQVLGIDISPQSDEFSLAVIAYEMLCGSKPFTGAKVSGLIFAICSDAPAALHDVNPALTSGVNDVVSKALAKGREQRYASPLEFMTALEHELMHCDGWIEAESAPEPIAVAAAASSTSSYFVEPQSAPAPVPAPAPAQVITSATQPFVPGPAAYELPSIRRQRRYEKEDDDFPADTSPVKKFAVAGLILFALAAAGVFFLNRSPHSDLPSQVLETNNGPVSPPPADTTTTKSQSVPPPSAATPQETASAQPEQQAPATPTPAPVSKPAAQVPSPSPAPVTTPARQPGSELVDVELLSDPPGAQMMADSNPVMTCRAPCTLSLRNGRHTLTASLAGYTLAQRIFNVPDTDSVFVNMPMLTGSLVVTSNPSASTILVDGKDYGLTPATLHLPPGQHRVSLLNGSQRHDETVTVVADGIQATGYTFPR